MNGCAPMLFFGVVGFFIMGPLGLLIGIIIGGFLGAANAK